MINFKLEEFACPCCKQMPMDPGFLAKIDEARTISGVPYSINSGYRCPKHNAEVGSTTKNHTSGKASDIKCEDMFSRLLVLYGLLMAGFKHIGIAKTFIHADTNEEAPKGIYLY